MYEHNKTVILARAERTYVERNSENYKHACPIRNYSKSECLNSNNMIEPDTCNYEQE